MFKFYSRSKTTTITNFILHKNISHLIFVLVPECGEYEICNQKIILRSISRQRPFFIDRFSIVAHEIPLRVRKKHVGFNAQSGRQ
jgi:hypothetical protein